MDARMRQSLDRYLTREPDPPTCGECGANLENEDHAEDCSQYEDPDGIEEDAEPDVEGDFRRSGAC